MNKIDFRIYLKGWIIYIYLIFITIRINYEIEDLDEIFTLNNNKFMNS